MSGPERPARDLEAALRDLGERLDWPPAPDLAGHVRRRLAAPVAPGSRVRSVTGARRVWPHPRLGLRAAVLLVLVLLVAGTLAVLPGPRKAIADLLGLGGVRITRGVPGPLPAASPAPGPLGEQLDLGERVGLPEARARAGRSVLLPSLPGMGPPDAVWLDSRVPGGAVSLVWRARRGLPSSGPSGVGMLITAFPGSLDADLAAKKLLGGATSLREVRVAGASGLWIEGAPHGLMYLGPDGSPRFADGRLAGNTLLWARDGRTMRLEAQVSQAEAVRIAASMR